MMRIVVVILLVMAVSCASSKKTMREQISGKWELSAFPAGDKSFAEIFGQRRPALEFNTTDLKVTGTTGCNQLSGTYTIQGNDLSFGSSFITTKMACPGYEESVFLDALRRVNRYELVQGQLRLQQDTALVMSFVRR